MKDDDKYIKYGKLLAGFIHNINSPLMGISGRFELLELKYPDEKSLPHINTQIEKVDQMLTNLAYLLNIEQSDNNTEIDLNDLLINFETFMHADKRYKNPVTKEISFFSHVMNINPADLINVLYKIFDYMLEFSEEGALFRLSNNKNIISINMNLNSVIDKKYNISDFINNNINAELLSKFKFKEITDTNSSRIDILVTNS
jgi:signal transduction histidine kinase